MLSSSLRKRERRNEVDGEVAAEVVARHQPGVADEEAVADVTGAEVDGEVEEEEGVEESKE